MSKCLSKNLSHLELVTNSTIVLVLPKNIRILRLNVSLPKTKPKPLVLTPGLVRLSIAGRYSSTLVIEKPIRILTLDSKNLKTIMDNLPTGTTHIEIPWLSYDYPINNLPHSVRTIGIKHRHVKMDMQKLPKHIALVRQTHYAFETKLLTQM